MIHSFSAKNFYCFKDKIEVSFEVDKKTATKDGDVSFVKSKYKDQYLSKILMVVGANASGKTNVLKVLSFLEWIIVRSYQSQPEILQMVGQPFLFNGHNENTELWVQYSIDEILYEYSIVFNHGIIQEEKLIKEQQGNNDIIIKRKWNSSKEEYTVSIPSTTDMPKGYSTRPDASMIGLLSNFGHDESKQHVDYWRKVFSNVSEVGFADDVMINNQYHVLPWVNMIRNISQYFDNTELKESVMKILRHFDLGIEDIKIDEKDKEKGVYSIESVHKNGKELPFQYESSGTQQLFLRLLNKIVIALQRGGILVMDEIDTKIHPMIVEQLIDLFGNPETNPHNAQIIFTTHEHSLLNQMDKSQILLVEKNKETDSSEVFKLSDIEGVDDQDDFYAKYLAEVYGATQKRDSITEI